MSRDGRAVAAPPSTCTAWGEPPLAFSLRTDSDEVRRRAEIVFRPWRRTGAAETPLAEWTIGRGPSSSWRVYAGAEGGTCVATRPTVEGAVTAVEFLGAQSLFSTAVAPPAFHAALVSRRGLGVLICGPSGAGKSTLACALWCRGFALLSDDAAAVDLVTGSARPAPRRVSVRAASRPLLGDELWTRIIQAPSSEPSEEGWLFHPDEAGPSATVSEVRVALCIFLARQGAGDAVRGAVPLPAAHAALALLPYANLARHGDVGTAIVRLAGFTAGVPAYDLARAPLAQMVNLVDRLLEAAS